MAQTAEEIKAHDKAYSKQYYSDHKEQKEANHKIWRSNNKEKIKARGKQYKLNHKEQSKAQDTKRRLKICYNLTPKQYDGLFKAQNGRCLICGTHQSNLRRALDVDHNHITNKVRGLLCGNCNLLLGNAKDNTDILKSAIKYLQPKPIDLWNLQL